MRKPRSTTSALAAAAIAVAAVTMSAGALGALPGPGTDSSALAGRTAGQVGAFLALDSLSGSTPPAAATTVAGASTTAAPTVPGGMTIALASLPAPVVAAPVTFPLATAPTTAPPPTVPSPAASAIADVWARLRQCESGGNYATDTGNGYYGAYQFSESTWLGIGETGYPNLAAPAIQDAAAQRLQARSGWGQWPSCSRQLGLL